MAAIRIWELSRCGVIYLFAACRLANFPKFCAMIDKILGFNSNFVKKVLFSCTFCSHNAKKVLQFASRVKASNHFPKNNCLLTLLTNSM